MDLDDVRKFAEFAADCVVAIGGVAAWCRWTNVIAAQQAAKDAEEEMSLTAYKREGDLPRLTDVATHNARVFLRLAKSDEDKAFAAKANTLAASCKTSRDVYVLRFVMASTGPCRNEPALLIAGDKAIAIADEATPDKSWDANVPLTEGKAIVSRLIACGLAMPSGDASCTITSPARKVVQSIVGYGARTDTFVPADEWDESIAQSAARSYTPQLPVTLVRIVK